MDDSSLMLRRVRRAYTRSRFSLPRRGRIRTVLAVAAVCGAVAFLTTRKGDRHGPSARAAAGTRRADVKRETRTPPQKPVAQRVKAVGLRRVGSSMSDGELGLLLNSRALALDAPSERFDLGSQSVVCHYAVDTSLERFARSLLDRYHPRYGAVVVIEPSSGRLRALVSYNNAEDPPLDSRLYCRSLFPAASVFKTVTAAAAVERAGLRPESTLRQAGRNHTLYKFQLEKDVEGYRDISLAEAFAYSVNPVFGRIGIHVTGYGALKESAGRFGFGDRVPFAIETDTSRLMQCDSAFALAELASGFNQQTTLSPLLGAMIAAAVAGDGQMPRPVLVDSVTDALDGGRLYRAEHQAWKRSVRPETAAALRSMMAEVVRYGTARSSFRYLRDSFRFRDLQFGGKTGSVDKDGLGKVDWFVGFVRDPADRRLRLAVSVVTVHGANWTVHSSYVAAELMRRHVRNVQRADERKTEGATVTEGAAEGRASG